MVEVTIKPDFEENGAVRSTEIKMAPCNLAFVACISPRDDERSYHSNISLVGGEGLKACRASGALADAMVKMLLRLAGDSRERQALVLAAFIESFTGTALEMAGTGVVDRVSDLMMKTE